MCIRDSFHTRDTLAALLWPEMDDAHARAALRRTLSSLKAAVGDLPLYVTRDSLGVNKDALWCDATEFEAAISAVAHHSHDAADLCAGCREQLAVAVALSLIHI